MLLEVAAFAILTALFSAMSEVDVAAHQIAMQVIHFSFLPALAIGEAASVMVGQAVGADEDRLVRPLARQTLWLTGAFTGLCALLFAAAAWPIAAAFSDDRALQQTTVHLLYVAAAFQLFDGANVVGRCVLRGTGDVRWPAAVNVAMAWLVTPPLTLLLGYRLGWGVIGGWLGFCAEIIGGAALLWWRLERGAWQRAAARSRIALEPDVEPAPASEQPLVAAPP
jgi:MATE family multidrug resistance protein